MRAFIIILGLGLIALYCWPILVAILIYGITKIIKAIEGTDVDDDSEN